MKTQELCLGLVRAALSAVDPAQAVRKAIRLREGFLVLGGQQDSESARSYDLSQVERVLVIGGGKAGAPMARALSEIVGEKLAVGWVNVKSGHVVDESLPESLTVHEAGHPIPDQAGTQGARRIKELAESAGERDLVFCLISGGGSALLPLPVPGITLQDLRDLTSSLLHCGATINEMNAVRKHCSQIKGGQLARAAFPARVISLILSDVVGNPLDVIASGPTVPDTTTYTDAYAVLAKYDLVQDVPPRIASHLRAGIEGRVPETPKPGDPVFDRVQNVVIGSNVIAAQAVRKTAHDMGYNTLLLTTYVEGEAREVARVAAAIAKSLVVEGLPVDRPACVVLGGETTVTLRGNGRGGRNQELALAAAIALEGWPDVMLVALATDGTDGPTDAAGAIVDGHTVSRARGMGLDAAEYLARNDSYTFLDKTGSLIRTGPTNTNVNDLLFIIAF